MAIDLSTFWQTWDVVSGNTSATTQYEFWNGMEMSTGQILSNQYEFFQYHNTTRYEWFKNLQNTYPEVYDEYTFYKNTNDPNIYDMRSFYEYGAQYLVPSGPLTPTPTPDPTPTPEPTPTPSPVPITIYIKTDVTDTYQITTTYWSDSSFTTPIENPVPQSCQICINKNEPSENCVNISLNDGVTSQVNGSSSWTMGEPFSTVCVNSLEFPSIGYYIFVGVPDCNATPTPTPSVTPTLTPTPSPTGDTDATAFFTAIENAGGTLTTTEKDAVTALVLSLKSASLWNKFYALYPMVGGTQTSCKFNLIDPQDLDSAFRITFAGGWTFSSGGAIGGGGYANTYFEPSTYLTSYYNSSFGSYLNDPTKSNIGMVFGGAGAGGTSLIQFGLDIGGLSIMDAYNTSNRYISFTPPSNFSGLNWVDYEGFGNNATLYLDTTTIGTAAISTTATPFSAYMFLGAKNQNNNFSDYQYSISARLGLSFIADSIGSSNVSTFYNIVDTFETALGRNV